MQRTKRNEIPLGWIVIGVATLLALIVSNASAQLLSLRQVDVAPASRPGVARVESVGFTVSDMDRALDFYTGVLPFEKISDVEVYGSDLEHLSGIFGARVRVVRLKLGEEVLELTEYLTPQGRPIPTDSRSNDRWFQHVAIIVSDMDRAYEHLRTRQVRHASTAPQTLPSYITAAAGIRAFYFKDFDNHVLEILSFPSDKGDSKWRTRASSGSLFLGIDHTAIVVGDTAESGRFYRDTLGLEIAGESVNYGTEQEHLNNVFGARLRITGLKTREAGIAVEFLEYLAPTNGRPYPGDSKSSDLWHWQTSFSVESNIESFDTLFRVGRYSYISTGLVIFDKPVLGFKRASLVRDPDGHAVRLVSGE